MSAPLSGCICLGFWLVIVTSGVAGDTDDILRQKNELQGINRDIELSRTRLDSLQAAESSVHRQISEYDQRITSDREVIRRLSKELNRLQTDVNHADSTLNSHQESYERKHRRYLGNIRQFYIAARQPVVELSDRPNEELELKRKVVYLTALAGFENKNVQVASGLLDQTVGELEELTGQEKVITGLKKKRETSYALGTSQKQKQQRSLDQLRRKSMDEADRIIMLQTAAEEMAAIIARLERQRELAIAGSLGDDVPSVFAGMKGQLPSPFRGKIVAGFGEQVDLVTRLKSYSPGITIKGHAGGPVWVIAPGTVVHTGNLRGYGNFVIIDHEHKYYTTYADLGEVLVSIDQYLTSRAKIGTSGDDGVVKFELRKGREPLDPVKWIKIESF